MLMYVGVYNTMLLITDIRLLLIVLLRHTGMAMPLHLQFIIITAT